MRLLRRCVLRRSHGCWWSQEALNQVQAGNSISIIAGRSRNESEGSGGSGSGGASRNEPETKSGGDPLQLGQLLEIYELWKRSACYVLACLLPATRLNSLALFVPLQSGVHTGPSRPSLSSRSGLKTLKTTASWRTASWSRNTRTSCQTR